MSYIWMREPADGRDARETWEADMAAGPVPAGYVYRDTIFRNHNCSRCGSGERACVHGQAAGCSWLHARND